MRASATSASRSGGGRACSARQNALRASLSPDTGGTLIGSPTLPTLPVPRRRAASAILGVVVSVVSLAAVGWWISRQGAPHLPDSPAGFAWLGAALVVIA